MFYILQNHWRIEVSNHQKNSRDSISIQFQFILIFPNFSSYLFNSFQLILNFSLRNSSQFPSILSNSTQFLLNPHNPTWSLLNSYSIPTPIPIPIQLHSYSIPTQFLHNSYSRSNKFIHNSYSIPNQFLPNSYTIPPFLFIAY